MTNKKHEIIRAIDEYAMKAMENKQSIKYSNVEDMLKHLRFALLLRKELVEKWEEVQISLRSEFPKRTIEDFRKDDSHQAIEDYYQHLNKSIRKILCMDEKIIK